MTAPNLEQSVNSRVERPRGLDCSLNRGIKHESWQPDDLQTKDPDSVIEVSPMPDGSVPKSPEYLATPEDLLHGIGVGSHSRIAVGCF
jgi:hypothetical protein